MKFSVLLPTRNRLDLLRYAVESVRRQDRTGVTDWEIIISDNASEEDIAGYAQTLGEPRLVYTRTSSFISVTENWNNALEKSTGDYVIMLGDDDALLTGCLARLRDWVQEYYEPDLIYLGGLVYAYPDVLPDAPGGYVQLHSYGYHIRGADAPFWLEDERALALVRATMKFQVAIDYNMQFSVISRRIIKEMTKSGPFFRSPFPDYYATNMLLLQAKRRLIVPMPLVAVGISPKSYGFYHSNKREQGGMAFLNSAPADQAQDRRLLPGTNINSSWLLSLEAIQAEWGRRVPKLKPAYRRYRWLQILYVYRNVYITPTLPLEALADLEQKLGPLERLLVMGIRLLQRLSPRALRRLLAMVDRTLDQFPAGAYWPPLLFQGRFKNILEVCDQIDPALILSQAPRTDR